MTLTMTFLGTGSAFTIGDGNFHSNILLETNGDSLLLDAGSDVRFSLAELGKNYHDVGSVYITHTHADHIGGLEWLALTSFFDPTYEGKPHLFAVDKIIHMLWDNALSAGLQTLPTEEPHLDTYFEVHAINGDGAFEWQGISFKLIQMIHACSNYRLMPCYGLIFQYGDTRILFTADTRFVATHMLPLYDQVDLIFHDCETSVKKTGVHAHYSELLELPKKYREKMWLYHYSPGPLPNAKKDGFLGFVKKGQCFRFEA